MEKEVKDFVLKALGDAYTNEVDALYRAQRFQSVGYGDDEYLQRVKQRVATAKKALAYFGVYR